MYMSTTYRKHLISAFTTTLVSLLLLFYPGLGQIPPSPNASSQAKFAAVPVNLHTGIPNIQAPLMTLPGRHLNIPIGLSYHAGGFKVQEIAGPVGLGWALNAGGVITRVVQGIPDDEPDGYSGKNKWGDRIVPIESYEVSGEFTSDLLVGYNAASMSDFSQGRVDGQPDMFYFNILGRSGRFVLDPDGTAVLLPHQDVEIKLTSRGGSQQDGEFLVWSITTEDGTVFTFGAQGASEEAGAAREETTVEHFVEGNLEDERTTTYTSSWYLSSITSPQSSEEVTFAYESASNALTYAYDNYVEYNGVAAPCNDVFSRDKITTRLTVQPRRLQFVRTVLGQVNFTYKHERSDQPDQQALSEVILRDARFTVKQRIQLAYGSFNSCEQIFGRAGVDLPGCRRLRLNSIEDVTDGTLPLYTFSYYDDENRYLPHRDSPGYDHWGYANGGRGAPPNTQELYEPYFSESRRASATFGQAYLLRQMTNAQGGYTRYDYENHYQGSDPNKRVGGARIHRIRHYDGISDNPAHETTYNYHGSGQALATPDYRYTLNDRNSPCLIAVTQAQSLVNLFDLNGAAISYGQVSTEYADGSRSTHYFTSLADQKDEITPIYRYFDSGEGLVLTKMASDNGPPFPPTTSYAWRRGLPTKREEVNSTGTVVATTDYHYNFQDEVSPRRTLRGITVQAFSDTYYGFDYLMGVNTYTSEPVYLKYQTESLFDQDHSERALVTRVDYDVDETYLTVKSQTTTNSEGQEVVTQYLRANDLKESNAHGSNLLAQAHMNSQVLEQSTLVDGRVVQKTSSSYTPEGDLIVPTLVTIYPDGTGAGITIQQEYNVHGNVIQTQRQNDLPTAHIWGYNHSLKVAEVVGQTYQQAASGLDLSVVQGNQADAIHSELDKLRQPNRLVTTYTYDPLTGMTSETNPAGITTHYDYDDRNRLQYVRDHRQQYVARYQYRYRGQPE
jgi:hypothetical protein